MGLGPVLLPPQARGFQRVGRCARAEALHDSQDRASLAKESGAEKDVLDPLVRAQGLIGSTTPIPCWDGRTLKIEIR
ncbi:MAG TPA: hypothetical protein VMT52_15935 [Planctomycetota bacterium]|nr:hypothetical protein [Planctomycetota bacterium]